jgi:hypothetical protein
MRKKFVDDEGYLNLVRNNQDDLIVKASHINLGESV